MKAALTAISILLLIAASAGAHRLDEYLLGTLISVGKDRIEAQMTLTPGVLVYPSVIAEIDTDGDGVVSESEQQDYAARVLRDLSLTVDGHRLAPRLVSIAFPAMDEMKEGRGEIRLDFRADLPRGGAFRRLILKNRHQTRIAAYQVNCLVPRDPDLRIVSPDRNYTQSE